MCLLTFAVRLPNGTLHDHAFREIIEASKQNNKYPKKSNRCILISEQTAVKQLIAQFDKK